MKIRVSPSKLRKVNRTDLAVRFVFGAAVSLGAGLVSLGVDPEAGGLLLAFPAILLATLTLIQKRDSKRKAEEDDDGAVLGALALIPFAVVTYYLLTDTPGAVALGAATVAWFVVAVVLYVAVYGARDAEEGEDEPSDR